MYQHFGSRRWLRYCPTGRLGVQLFFVLSGFLITAILLLARDRVAQGETRLFEIRQFYARRFLRIFPLYYGVVIGAAMIGVPGFREPLLWHLGYMTNVQNAITNTFPGATGHLWTLSVEEQFYFVWPWLILLLPGRWLLPVLCAVTATGPLFRSLLTVLGCSYMPIYTLTPASLDAFGFGALLALARQRKQATGDGQLRHWLTRIGLIIGLPTTVITLWSLAWPKGYFWIFAIGANLALSLVFTWLIDRSADGFSGLTGRVLSWRPLLFLGTISYGLYIFHFIMVNFVLRRILAWPLLRNLEPLLRWHGVKFLTLSLMTFVAACLSWFLYERPILRLKRFFPYTRSRR